MSFASIIFFFFLILSKTFSQEFVLNNLNDLSKNSFDVLSYNIHLDLSESFEYKKSFFDGSVKLRIKSLSDSLSSILLDAVRLNIDTVKLASKPLKFEQTETSLLIHLDKKYNINEIIELEIIYKRDYRSHPNVGFYFYEKSPTVAENLAFVSSYPQDTRYWLPCKDEQNDKAFINLSLKIPKDYTAVTNGCLISEEVKSDDKIVKFNDVYPISTYTFAFFVSKFSRIEEDILLNGDKKKISFYCWKKDSIAALNATIDLRKIAEHFSNIFGGYPFSNLKYLKIYSYPFSAFSAQSMIILNSLQMTNFEGSFIQAHELAHQWFGSNVNAFSWSENWLHEDFATFWACQYQNSVYGEYYNKEKFIKDGKSCLEYDYVVNQSSFPNYGSGKGAIVLEMLRYIVGDTVISNIFKKYAKDFTYSNSSTGEFINVVNEVTKNNYNWFFDEWVYNLGYPVYDIKWIYDNKSKELLVNIDQLQTTREAFIMPLEFRINYLERDTLIKLVNNLRSQTFTISLPTEPINIIFDPDSKILIKELNSITAVPEFDNEPVACKLDQNFPNPFNPLTTISYQVSAPCVVTLKVYEILGKKAATLVNEFKPEGKYFVNFDGSHLSSGFYIYELRAGDFISMKKMILLK